MWSSSPWALSACLLGVSLPAAASDMSGIRAVFIGIPAMAVAAVLIGALAGFPRRHPAVYAVTAVIAAIVLLPFGRMMDSDAVSILHKGYPGYAVTSFALYALAAVVFVAARRAPPCAGRRGAWLRNGERVALR